VYLPGHYFAKVFILVNSVTFVKYIIYLDLGLVHPVVLVYNEKYDTPEDGYLAETCSVVCFTIKTR
jgi:hypothetical protein